MVVHNSMSSLSRVILGSYVTVDKSAVHTVDLVNDSRQV